MKKLLFLFSLMCAALVGTAQIATDWTADMPSAYIPSGVTLTDCDTLDSPYIIRFTLDLDATTYDNATAATAFDAIGDAVKTALDVTYFGLDPADNIVMAYVITSIDRRWDTFDHPDKLLQYIVAEDIFRVTGFAKYVLP